MATSFYFNGRRRTLPGVYSRIVSGRQNPPLDLDYGNVLIIDNTASGVSNQTASGIRGGSGVAGELNQNKDSIYRLTNLSDFREFVGHGWWWKAAEFLFRPNGSDPGVSNVYVIKPATTTASNLAFTGTGGGSNGGTFRFKTRDEGTEANGSLTSTKLTKGYAYSIITGRVDTNKWIFQTWRGTYKGLHSDGIAYDEIDVTTASNSPELLAESPEFDNIQELIDWANSDTIFGSYFVLDSDNSSVTGTGAIDQADVTAVAGFNVSTGGSETYDQLNAALEAVKDLDYNFVITNFNNASRTPHADSNILSIKGHIETEAKYDKFLVVQGDDTDITRDVTSAESFDSDRVILVNSSIRKVSQATNDGFRTWDSLFHMAYIVGRLAGLPPQVPLTFKGIDIDGITTTLNETQQTTALNAGIITTYFDSDFRQFIVLQDVNTLQSNQNTLNPDGTSHVIQFRRIAAQLNKELIVNSKLQLLSDPAGVNRNTLSEQDVVNWTRSSLERKIATDNEDNLILSYQNVVATRNQDAYFITYEFVPNDEIRILFFTGFAL